jgi:hypothetical protein
MLVRFALFFSLSLFLCPSANAVNEYYSISRSVRALGMGGAFYGLSDDQYALFYNPAGLSFYRGDPELMMSVGGYVPSELGQVINTLNNTSQLNTPTGILNALSSYQGSSFSAGAGLFPFYLQKNFAIGLLIADTKINAALLGNNFDTSIDVTGISDSGLFIGYGRTVFDDHLHVGFNTKIMGRVGGHKTLSALDLVSPSGLDLNLESLGGAGIGLDFDVGATYELPHPILGISNRFSLVFNNILASDFNLIPIEGTPPGLPRLVSFGSVFVFPGYGVMDNVNVLLDLAEFEVGGQTDQDLGARDGSFFKHVNFGVEVPLNGWFVLRGGLHQGDFTAGLGIELKFLKVEFATYAEQLDLGLDRLVSRRYMLQLTFGAGSSAPPPLTAGFVEASDSEPEPKPVRRSMKKLNKNLLENPNSSEPRKPDSVPQGLILDEQNERQPPSDSDMNRPTKKEDDRLDLDRY